MFSQRMSNHRIFQSKTAQIYMCIKVRKKSFFSKKPLRNYNISLKLMLKWADVLIVWNLTAFQFRFLNEILSLKFDSSHAYNCQRFTIILTVWKWRIFLMKTKKVRAFSNRIKSRPHKDSTRFETTLIFYQYSQNPQTDKDTSIFLVLFDMELFSVNL